MTQNTVTKFDLNAYLLDPDNLSADFRSARLLAEGYRQVRPILCEDGFSMSVQASMTHYCTPRNAAGPWTDVEIGYPSQPIAELEDYTYDGTVYSYVPVALVEKVVNDHGGLRFQ